MFLLDIDFKNIVTEIEQFSEIKIEDGYMPSHFYATEDGIRYEVSLSYVGRQHLCSCGEESCRHIQATQVKLKNASTANANKKPIDPDRGNKFWRSKLWESRWQECKRVYHKGVYLDPDIEF